MAGKRRPLDNIEKDVIAAMELGYGVHYGHYKADHPHTREDKPEPQIPEEYMRTCRYCGRQFSTRGQHYRKLYCDDDCRQAYNSRQKYLAKQRKEELKNAQALGE